MARRVTKQKLQTANRNDLKSYLKSCNVQTYPEESISELRDTAIHYFEMNLPEECPELQTYGGEA